MSIFNRRSLTRYGVRCDDCGRIANNPNGEYTRPDGTAGYINDSSFPEDENGQRISNAGGRSLDRCEECADKLRAAGSPLA